MRDPLAIALRHAVSRHDVVAHQPRVLDPGSDEGELRGLAADRSVVVVDTVLDQLAELVCSRQPDRELTAADVDAQVSELLAGEPAERFGCWVFYPWSRRLVHVLPSVLHRELRLDRNRYKITPVEQARLLDLRVAIAGLSVGRAVATTLVREGLVGHLRLADFDAISLSNLNRVAGGVADIGMNKAVLAAREVAELDPFIWVDVHLDGVRPDAVEDFLDGVDVLIDECDDLEMKLQLREHARARQIPVVMVTSDRGLLDVERFDREPDRPAFHGLFAGVRAEDLHGLTTRQKVPYVLRVLDASRLEPRMGASLVEVRETLSTWPQLASDVVLGGAVAAHAVRRIALGELTESGRFAVDLDALVRDGAGIDIPAPGPWIADAAATEAPELVPPAPGADRGPSADELTFLVACATLAPSGGNAQPWRFVARGARLSAEVDGSRSSLLDHDGRASVLALGAALEAALVGARALGFRADVSVPGGRPGPVWELELSRTARPGDMSELALLSARCCRRTTAESGPLPADLLAALSAAGAPAHVATVARADQLALLGEALAELDRVQFLSPDLHRELISELRWTPAEARATRDGIDIAALALDATDLAALEILRSRPAMDVLRRLDRGRALGASTRTAFRTTRAALVIAADPRDRPGLVEAGRGLLRLWLDATAHDIGVHPWGSPFLIQLREEAPHRMDAWQRRAIDTAAEMLGEAAELPDETSPLMVLRLTTDRTPVARSLRRTVDEVLRITP